jgi:hypothetical protein
MHLRMCLIERLLARGADGVGAHHFLQGAGECNQLGTAKNQLLLLMIARTASTAEA